MKKYKVDTLTLKEVEEMLINGDDEENNQIQITDDGYVFLSQNITPDKIENIKFKYASFGCGGGYVGPTVLQGKSHIKHIYAVITYAWKYDCKGWYETLQEIMLHGESK